MPDSTFPLFDHAIALARQAASNGEVPVGAMVVERASGRIIGQAHNRVETDQDALAHAECVAIRAASQIRGDKWLTGCDLYVTLEPCAMCAGAISHARLDRVIFGAFDPKSGGVDHGARVFNQATTHHKPEVIGGIREIECAQLLTDFFAAKR